MKTSLSWRPLLRRQGSCVRTHRSLGSMCPNRSREVLSSPVLVFDHSVHCLLHLLGEGQGVGGELLSRRATTFLCLLHLLVLVPPPTAAGAGRGRAVVVAVSLALSCCLFMTHLLFNVL